MKANGLPATERLKSRTRIDLLFQEGSGGFVYPIRYVLHSVTSAASSVSTTSAVSPTPTPSDLHLDLVSPSVLDSTAGSGSVLVSVSKRNHKRAHVRNLLKRRMREAYRLNKQPVLGRVEASGETLSLGLLYVSNDVTDYQTIEDAIRKIIRKITQAN